MRTFHDLRWNLVRLGAAAAFGAGLAGTGCAGDDGATSSSTGTGTASTSASGTSAGSTAASTATATGTSAGSASGTGTTATTATATAATTVGSTTGAGSTTSAGTVGTTGGGVMPECTQDTDCTVHEDCCSCEAVPVSDVPPDCEAGCQETACAALEYKAMALCVDGICRFPETTCDPSSVVCGAPTPNCPDGTLPEVMGQCWTFKCVPVAACDWVPDCSFCDAETEVCVTKVTQLGPVYDCEPKPWQCGDGPADCTCAGALCEPPFDTCMEGQAGSLQCTCPNCG